MPPQILKLMAIAATLTRKSIRLSGESLSVRSAMIHNSQGNDDPRLLLELALPQADPCTDPDCQCGVCITSRAITPANAAILAHLMREGVAPDDSLVFESSFFSDDGFHVKLCSTADGRSFVGHGGNLTIALARATTAAITP